ncbi:MAG TPA: type II toxin-antitoxin system RelE/ParE family toxin [Lentisphaeria bacterium]|nr:MAG: plasmid stabilization protein [Lentisphaerae bacterium GWF2_50_93]HCE43544.1 type II toxin-antitoxin system RelE/ParE family toxin [Lentisphaeria bacterium]
MKVHWTESAVEDLKGIKYYIAKDSEYYAINFTDRIISSVEKLSSLPEMGRKIPEADENNIREIILRPYRIIYQIQEDSINIITIVNSARDLSNPKLKKWEIG